MKKNVGIFDQFVRILLVGFIFYAYFMGWTQGWIAFGSALIAVLLFVTAFSGECYLYNLLGISTKRNKKAL